jgi:hypothetical protein
MLYKFPITLRKYLRLNVYFVDISPANRNSVFILHLKILSFFYNLITIRKDSVVAL